MSSEPRTRKPGNQKPARRRYDRYVTRTSTLPERGFSCVALESPTDQVNVGHALRASLCFRAGMVILSQAPDDLNVRRLKTDPGKAYRHVPVVHTQDLFSAIPEECTPVAVELTDDALDLSTFIHPERACYIFGPENGSVSQETLDRCKLKVKIPTVMSLNLGMTVNIVLYDRAAKAIRNSRPHGQ